jgi:hypothetical protein
MAYDNFLIDKRVVDRNIAKGLVDGDELKKIIEALPDREQNCVHVSLDGDSSDAFGDDEDLDDDEEDLDDDEDDEDEDEEEAKVE